MFKAEGLQIECKVMICNGPLVGKIEDLPLPAAFIAAVVMSVGVLPASVRFGGIPDDLRIRTNQEVIAPALQFFSV